MSPERKTLSLRRSGGLDRWRGPYPLLFSLVLGAMIWGYVDSRRMVVEEFDVALEIEIPQGWQFVEPPADTVRVRARGPRQVMRSVRRDRLYLLEKIEIPESGVDAFSPDIVLEPEDVDGLSGEITVLSLDPYELHLHLARLKRRWVAVEPVVTGKPEAGYTVGVIQAEPRTVPVMAPQYVIDRLTDSDVIRTRPVDISGKRAAVSDRVELEPLVKDEVEIKVPGTVYVLVELPEVPAERTFVEAIPVRVLLSWPLEKMENLTLSPPAVKVTVMGPELVVTRLSAADITVYVDVRQMVPKGQGIFTGKCQSLAPEKVRVVRIDPEVVEYRTAGAAEKAESGAKGKEGE